MGKHVDDLRPFDQEGVRNPSWAYGERAYWRTAEKLDDELRKAGDHY